MPTEVRRSYDLIVDQAGGDDQFTIDLEVRCMMDGQTTLSRDRIFDAKLREPHFPGARVNDGPGDATGAASPPGKYEVASKVRAACCLPA